MKMISGNPAHLFSLLLLLAWVAVTTVVASAYAAETASAQKPAPVVYRHITEDGPQSIHVVEFDLARPDLAVVATVGTGVYGEETVPEMVARLPEALGKPLAAINGDYFEFKGEPRYFGTLQGMCIVEGELVASPPGTAFWIDKEGMPRLGRVTSQSVIVWPDGREPPFGVNCSTLDFKSEVRATGVVLFTPRYGRSTHTAENTREWVLRRAEPGGRGTPPRLGETLTARVSKVVRTGDVEIPHDAMVLAVANAAKESVPDLAVGDTVQLRIASTPELTGARTAVSGGPMLLAGGKTLTNPARTNRAPRTAVGLAGSRVVFVVVDGRRPGTAIGMTHHELAELMRRLGCTDALNLDGGGLSTLWYEGRVRNRPADDTPRSVGSALVLMKRPH